MLPPMLPPMHAMRTPQPTALPSLKQLHTVSVTSVHLAAPTALLNPLVPPRHPLGEARVPSEQLRVLSMQPHRKTAIRGRSEDASDDNEEEVEVEVEEEVEEGEESASSRPYSPDGSIRGDDKRARRKEQCRVNQANYRKRKRQHEQQLAGYIRSLETEIQELTTRKLSLAEQDGVGEEAATALEHAIASFYYTMQALLSPPALPPSRTVVASVASLLNLQFEQFASLGELVQTWSRYRQEFQCFRLHVLSSERLEVGEHAIIKMEAELEIALPPSEHDQWRQRPLACAVQQRFEIDAVTNSVTRITSEVDLIAALAAATRQTPRIVAQMFDDLVR